LVDRRSLSPTPALSPPSIEREAGIGNTKGTSREAEGYVEGKNGSKKNKRKEQSPRCYPSTYV